MIRLLTILLFSLAVCEAAAQLFTGAATSISLGAETDLHISGQAYLNGDIENNGEINFQHDVDFGTINQVGHISLSGSGNQSLFGNTVSFTSLLVNNEDGISLFLDSAHVGASLDLVNGIVFTNSTVLKSTGSISNESQNSFIEGSLLVRKTNTGDQLFPMGKDGIFNPLTLSSLPGNSEVKVTMINPDLSFPIVGDSLIGVYGNLAWSIEYMGERASSIPTLAFNGINLAELITDSTIRAPEYKPVIACLPPVMNSYHLLKTSMLNKSDDRTFGKIIAAQNLLLETGNKYILAIGLQPAASELQFYVPNIFSPNAQNHTNKKLRPFLQGTTINSLEMTIWDQFNNVIFQEFYSNPDMNLIGWDGYLPNGKEAPQGAYFYSIELNSADGNFNKKSTTFLTR
ncbi:C-terminal domain of CHU protein family protein [Ekhidna lutea]|uniref:C-terminal domain of CHU protein family protein n=1 Tax=Ekhidna lutea TaxID=447679 RepID=A0A239JN98_EKHLU|nr:gliding motility-associated C-terminal domain-containing protein [Ekhidna lutea]SNT07496.1 C-terminal domain of CHU protein family protein [Ekhidna lutea]